MKEQKEYYLNDYISFIKSQRMNKNRDVVLENPFHPLDLAPRDLLTIYKRFEESRIINRNPKQQLPIEVISQLISSLKGCPPSYIQKCISQALIKQTISWNQFLTFLDQQSEVRQKILQWLMYQKTAVRFKQEREWPYRSKINTFYQEITFLKYIQFNEQEKLVLICVDKIKFYLFTETNGKITIIDTYENKSERIIEKCEKNQEEFASHPTSKMIRTQTKNRNKTNVSKSYYKVQSVKEVEKALHSVVNSAQKMPQISNLKQDQDTYFRKERKNINSLFNIFKELDIDNGIVYAKAVAPKIFDRSLMPTQVSQLRQIYSGGIGQQKNEQKKIASNVYNVKPLDVAYGYLKQLHRQKRGLTYNPYSYHKNGDNVQYEMPKYKKIIKQRKSKEYTHQTNSEVYNDKLRCFAIIFFNMQLALVKLSKEFNKISLQFQDKIKINTESQHKKNEIIEAIDFYYHTIVNKWFLIVLIRVEYKNEFRNGNQSYVRGYEIQIIDNKRKTDKNYRFKQKKETFSFPLGVKDKVPSSSSNSEVSKNQVFKMLTQTQFGIHFITIDGKYLCFKQDYIEKQKKLINDKVTINEKCKKTQDVYFSFYYQEKFKNAGLSLSCLALSLEYSKLVFGSIRGTIIIYDVFSHFFKMKKVSNSQISDIKINGSIAYILTLDQKLILLDLVKAEQIQNLSVRNENKLHQKVKKFQIFKNIIYFYGSEVRSYCQYIDQKMLHQSRKMQTIYKWRLDKLFKQEYKFDKYAKNNKEIKKLLPRKQNLGQKHSNIEIVHDAQSYFLVLTQILELIVVEKKSLKIKFTLILSIPHDSKVMKMAFSQNQKLLALLLFNQSIYIFNIYTQDLYQHIKPSPFFKYTSLTFLDLKNQYLLANGTENGKLLLSPYNSIPQKNPKVLQHHKKSITTLVVVKNQYLVSCGQDMLISIWLLPFNVLKHEIKLNHEMGFVYDSIGSFKELLYLKALEGGFIEINVHQGKLLKHAKQLDFVCSKLDACTGQMLGISKKNQLQIITKSDNEWKKVLTLPIQIFKNDLKDIGIVKSQKAIIFLQNGSIIPWNYQNQKMGKIINLCKQ